MTKLAERSRIGTNAVLALRKNRLSSGLPFMINTQSDNETSSYLEYPDGEIYLVKRNASGLDFEKIRQLSNDEAAKLRAGASLF